MKLEKLSENLFRFHDTCEVYIVKSGSNAVAIDFGDGAVLEHLGDIGVSKLEGILHTHHHRDQCQGDTKANALSIRTLGVSAVRVYVMDGMFDLARPVTLKLNGRTWRGKVPVSARCLLTHYADTRDATALIVNELDIDAAGKVTVRYK